MNSPRFILLALAGLLSLTPARAVADSATLSASTSATASLTPANDALATLRQTVAARIAQSNQGIEVPNRFDWTGVESELEPLASLLKAGKYPEAQTSVRNLGKRFKAEELKQLLEAVNSAIDAQKLADTELRRQKVAAQLAEISALALKAEAPLAIDPLFDQLSTIEEELGNNYDSRLGRVRNQINTLQNFLRQWQDLIDQLASGDTQQARQTLNNLRNNSVPPGLSRSEFRERLKALRAKITKGGTLADTVATLSLSNLAEAQQQLIDGSDYGWNNDQNERNNLASQIDAFLNADAALATGNPDEALQILRLRMSFYNGTRTSLTYPALQRLRNQWVIRALPALTGQSGLAPANKDETAGAYVQRLLLAADQAEDWDRALALAHVAQFLEYPGAAAYSAPGTPSPKGNPELAIATYQRALLMEQARQPAAAAELHREALKQGAPPRLQTRLIARLRELSPQDSK